MNKKELINVQIKALKKELNEKVPNECKALKKKIIKNSLIAHRKILNDQSLSSLKKAYNQLRAENLL